MPIGKPNKGYTHEFKLKAFETMHIKNWVYREAARQFEITDHKTIT